MAEKRFNYEIIPGLASLFKASCMITVHNEGVVIPIGNPVSLEDAEIIISWANSVTDEELSEEDYNIIKK